MSDDAERLRAALARLGLSQSEAARRWRLAEREQSAIRRIQRWVAGHEPVPPWVWVLIDLEEGNLHPRRAE